MMPERIKNYLLERGLTSDVITRYNLGFDGHWITIPIERSDGTKFLKYRRDPALDKAADRPEKFKTEPGGKRTLYLARELQETDTVFVTEGELDTLRLRSAGLFAVSSTTGASSWSDEWGQLFKGKTVYVWYDADDAGRQGGKVAAESIARHATKTYIVRTAAAYGKDITDILQKLPRPFTIGALYGEYKGIDTFLVTPRESFQPPPLPHREADRPPILEVLERYGVRLRKRGSEYIGCCVAHDDHSPSMSVNAEKGVLFCHACGFKGSAYDVVMAMEKVDFKRAKDLLTH